ncbi:MAG: YfhO family protein [Verrucomicrobia bacterium]|nr:YfhO family protein [Verrucomicrobiota bacterium]
MLSAPTGDAPEFKTDERLRPGRFAALLAVLIIAAFPDVIFGARTFFYRDSGIFGYPIAYYHRESFWQGEMPLWNPLNNRGLPFLAQWNTMVLYPLSLFYVLFPLSWSLGVFCLLHLFLAGLGMYGLARQWTANKLAASVAGLAFAFNGLTLSCLKWPKNIASLAWMPFVVWLTERGWREGGRKLVLAALAGAFQMLTGGPEIILLTWVFVGLLWISDLFARRQMRGMIVARFPCIILLVAGLAAIQLVPFLDLLKHSQRDATFRDASWSLPLWGWANLFVPLFRSFPSHQGVFAQLGQYWISSYYMGIGLLALALAAPWLMSNRRTWLLAAVTAISLILSFGDAGLVFQWLRKLVPPLQIVRFPVKFVVLLVFTIPLMAAFAIARMRTMMNAGQAAASGPSWIVIAQTHYHPWRAYIHGKPKRLWRANHFAQAIEVPGGRSSVQLIYQDRAFVFGGVLSVLALGACGWLWFRRGRDVSARAV